MSYNKANPGEVINSVVPQSKEEKEQIRANFNFAAGYFGQVLDHECPIVVCDCIAYLRNRGFYETGVFRIPGNQDMVNNLKSAYNARFATKELKERSTFSILNNFRPAPSVNDVASLLKAFFTDLAEPLIPRPVTKALTQIDSMGLPQQDEIRAFSKIIKRMKSPNRECLCFLISFLRELCAFRKFNQMTAANLSTCFVLSLMGKGDANEQIMIVAAGTRILKKLISEEVKISMPSVSNVRRNTRYKDVTAQKKGPTGGPDLTAPPANFQDPNSQRAQGAPRPPARNRYDGMPEPQILDRTPHGLPTRPPRPTPVAQYGDGADDLFGGMDAPPPTEQRVLMPAASMEQQDEEYNQLWGHQI